MCGTTSPIQPITPDTDTAVAVISVAATITTPRTQPDVDAERLGFIVAERHHADPPAQRHQRHEAHDHQRHDDLHVARLDARQAAEQPEGDGGQLVVGIGQHLDERDARAGQRADDDAGQHQHEDLVLAAQGAAPGR